MKYIITSGCSFTKNMRFNPDKLGYVTKNRNSWPESLQKQLGEEYTVLNYGSATNDNVSICRIIFYYINKLLKDGVSPNDIIVGIQWSDPHREAFFIERDFSELGEDFVKIQHTLRYTNKENQIFFLTGGYMPPTSEDSAAYKLGLVDFLEKHAIEILSNNIINPTLHWLESWSHLYEFMENRGIKSFYMTMRNILSKNIYENNFDNPEHNFDIASDEIWLENYDLLVPYLDYLPITTKSWYYKNYNGLLEWTRDSFKNYGETPYQESIDLKVDYDYYIKHIEPSGYGHPSPKMMDIFVKEELKPFLDERIFN